MTTILLVRISDFTSSPKANFSNSTQVIFLLKEVENSTDDDVEWKKKQIKRKEKIASPICAGTKIVQYQSYSLGKTPISLETDLLNTCSIKNNQIFSHVKGCFCSAILKMIQEYHLST